MNSAGIPAYFISLMIAIRGAKGVGKTTLMLQYMKLHGCDFKTMLYASADSTYFTRHTFYALNRIFLYIYGNNSFTHLYYIFKTFSTENFSLLNVWENTCDKHFRT